MFCKTTKKTAGAKNSRNGAKVLGAVLACALLLNACNKKDTNPSSVPAIKFGGISKDSLQVGTSDILTVNFSFTDKNGDLQNDPASGNYDIYFIDKRFDSVTLAYFFPVDIRDYAHPTEGLAGVCDLNLEAAFIPIRNDTLIVDSVTYEFYIKDRAGNESNHLTMPQIKLYR